MIYSLNELGSVQKAKDSLKILPHIQNTPNSCLYDKVQLCIECKEEVRNQEYILQNHVKIFAFAKESTKVDSIIQLNGNQLTSDPLISTESKQFPLSAHLC